MHCRRCSADISENNIHHNMQHLQFTSIIVQRHQQHHIHTNILQWILRPSGYLQQTYTHLVFGWPAFKIRYIMSFLSGLKKYVFHLSRVDHYSPESVQICKIIFRSWEFLNCCPKWEPHSDICWHWKHQSATSSQQHHAYSSSLLNPSC